MRTRMMFTIRGNADSIAENGIVSRPCDVCITVDSGFAVMEFGGAMDGKEFSMSASAARVLAAALVEVANAIDRN